MMADVILILDESTSIVVGDASYDNWFVYILGFGERIVSTFTISPTMTQVGLLKFSDSTTIAFYLNQYMDNTSLINAISQIDIDGGETNIAAAFRVTR